MNRIEYPQDRNELNAVSQDKFNTALKFCQRPVENAHSLPAMCYHSTAIQDLEIERIFRQSWLGLGRADRLKEAGQYETMEIAGIPIILIKDQSGTLHGFNNACLHRGARLLGGEGQCRGIRCPFHSWSYRLNGEFVHAPHMEATEQFNPSDMKLVEFPIVIHNGFIFICLNDTPPDFQQCLGNFDTLHSPWPVDSLVTTRRITFEVQCNWKLFLDVFNEYYHLQYVHPDSISDIYQTPDPIDAMGGSFTSQFGVTDGTGGLLQGQQAHALPSMPGLTGRSAKGTRYTWMFPNMTFALSGEAMWIYEAYPINPDRCLAVQTLCFPEQSVALEDFSERVQYYYDRFDAAVEEDRIALENQQLGLNSPFTQPGRYSVTMEPSVAMFSKWYAQQMNGEE